MGVVEEGTRPIACIDQRCTVYRTRGIAQIHPLGSYRALIGSPNTILTSLDPAWKPQLTNGRSDLCRFPDTSSDDKLPDRAGILTQTSP